MTETLAITGALDAARIQAMRPELDAIAEIEDDIEIDMSACSFLDSSGVGAIVFLYKRKRAHGFVVTLNGLSGQPMKLLRHLGVAGLLTDPRKNAA